MDIVGAKFVSNPQEGYENGFVMDFGKLKTVRAWLDEHFDPYLIFEDDDPFFTKFKELETLGACKLCVSDDVGMEGTAAFVFNWLNQWVHTETQGRVCPLCGSSRE